MVYYKYGIYRKNSISGQGVHRLNTVKLQSKVYRTIDLLREFGYKLPEPYCKALRGTPGLKELRVKLATDICRLFYFHYIEKNSTICIAKTALELFSKIIILFLFVFFPILVV